VQFKLGLAQLRGGDKASATRTFETLVRRGVPSPWTQRATFEAAQVHYKDGRPQQATPLLTKLMASQPGEDLAAPALYLQAWIDYDAKKHAGAAGRFAELARRYPKHELAAEATYQQGVCLAEAGKSDEALGVLRGYVRANPQGKHAVQAKHQVGRCLAKLGRHGEAVKVFAALAADARGVTADLLYELAWSQRESKDAEAAKLLEGVVSDKTAEASVLSLSRYRLGWCYDKLNEPAKAAAVFGPYARQHPDSEFAASAMYQAGVAYAKLDKLDEAARQFAALVTRFGKHDLAPAAALKLGEVLSQAQEYDKSAEAYRAFLKAHPKSKFVFLAQFGIGWAMENRRKYDDARTWYGKVIAAHNGPTAARAQFQTGECYFAESKFEKAAGELLKVEIVYAYPQWSARALYEAGRAFEAMKRADQARQQYKACATKYKDSPSGRQAAKRLKELAGGVEPTGP
jgi:TolA-binding protein